MVRVPGRLLVISAKGEQFACMLRQQAFSLHISSSAGYLQLSRPLLLYGGNFGEDGDPFGFHFVAQPEGSFRAQQRPWLKMLRIAHGDLRCAAPADVQRMLCSPE
jgi:hypothetical protein